MENITMINGEAYYARWLVKVDLTGRPDIKDQLHSRTRGGVFCYNEQELDFAKGLLDRHGLNYETQELEKPDGFDYTIGKRYRSRSEVLRHLIDREPPASEEIPELKRRLSEAEGWATAAAKKVQELEERLNRQQKQE